MPSDAERGVIATFRETIVAGPDGGQARQVAERIQADILEACRRRLGGRGVGATTVRTDGLTIEARTQTAAFEASLNTRIAHNQTYRHGIQQDFLAVAARVELRSELLARAERVSQTAIVIGYLVGAPLGLGGIYLFWWWMQYMADHSASGTFTFIDLGPWSLAAGVGLGLAPAMAFGSWLKDWTRRRVLRNPAVAAQLTRWEGLVEDLRAIKARKRAIALEGTC
ncbi:MAG: hypothetical protein ABIO70_22250 [Pseudomonadota bacterium]